MKQKELVMKRFAIRVLLLMGTLLIVVLPAGREACEFRTIGSFQFCRAVGNECYYFEVYG